MVMKRLWDILSGAGNLVDLPGSMFRDVAGGENPLDQLLSPFSAENRLTGRDVNRRWGLAGEQDTGLNAAGGVATELALDPLSWLGAGALFKALRGAGKAASTAGTAGRAVQRTGLQQALSRSARPATAYSIASPVAGAYLIGDNASKPPEQQESWKNWVGGGLMAAPLALGMAKGAKGLAAKLKPVQEATVQASRQGPFYSRLQEALLNAPEEFAGRPEITKTVPAKTIRYAETGEIVKEMPERTIVQQPGATANEMLMKYLEGKAHPEEIKWVLGQQFADQPSITRQSLMDAFEKGKINLETQRHGGVRKPTELELYEPGIELSTGYKRAVGNPMKRQDALDVAREATRGHVDAKALVKRSTTREHGPLVFPDKHWWIPGGKNQIETPIFSKGVTGFGDPKHHYGDDTIAWANTSDRKMADGRKMMHVEEVQSDWEQMGAKEGYLGSNLNAKEQARFEELHRILEQKHSSLVPPPEMDEWENLLTKSGTSPSAIPNMPFKGNLAMELAIKQKIADAIEGGYDVVSFANPKLVHDTQGMPIEKAKTLYDQILPNIVNKMLKPYGIQLEKMELPHGPQQLVLKKGVTEEEIANALTEGRGFRDADEMAQNVAHYHSLMRKGTAGEETRKQLSHFYENAPETILGFVIPEAMKKTAKTKGFSMMSVAPFAAAAGTGALARSLQDHRQEPQE